MQPTKVQNQISILLPVAHRLFTTVSPLREAWGNPKVRNKLEAYVLNQNFETANRSGIAFLKELDSLCRRNLSEDNIFDQLSSFFKKKNRLHISFIQDRKNRLDQRVHQVIELLGEVHPNSLLDIGCGSGEITNELKSALGVADNENVLGLEVIIPEHKYSFKILQYDGTTFPVGNESFDFTTIFSVLHHIEKPEEIIQEISRVIKPGGHLVVRECNSQTYEDWLFNLVCDLIWYRIYTPNPDVPIPGNYFSIEEWQRMFEQKGFKYLRSTFPELNNPYQPVMMLFQKD